MKQCIYSLVTALLPVLLRIKSKQQLSILTYHRVMLEQDFMRPTEPSVKKFEWQMKLIAKYFNPLPLSDAIKLMDYGELPPRAVCVTFDDGYSDNERLALPVLEKLNIPATVFVTTGYLNGGRMWNDTIIEVIRNVREKSIDLTSKGLGVYDVATQDDRFRVATSIIREVKHWPPQKRESLVETLEAIGVDGELPKDLMMTDSQVKGLVSKGVSVGAHTETHPILATLNLNDARKEIVNSKEKLELLLGEPVLAFAYPNGRPGIDYRIEHRDLVEVAGYECAVSTQWGVATKDSDKWQLPRFTPWDNTPLRFLIRLLMNLRNSL